MWVLVAAILLLAGPADAAILWFSGMEIGDNNELGTKIGAGACLQTQSAVHTGAWALGCNPSSVLIPENVTLSGTTFYTRFYFRYTGTPGGPGGQGVVLFANAAVNKYINICRDQATGVLFWAHSNCTAIASGTTNMTVDTWYLIEVKAVVSNTVGGAEVKINGNTEFTSFGTDTSDIVSITGVYWGPNQSGLGLNSFFDDMMVCDSAYCPPGVSIARQGTSGTPTYDTWTKTSCTGGTIDGCWSNTPFDATSNANSATATNAQTMVVHDFASTQTGHGTETIGAGSTINACKTVAIMKSGTGAAPVSIRRRLSGVDTDTAKTLTTSDAPYDDGIWTTTTAILRNSASMEIGMLHGAGVATDTVEDMWLMCDYLNVDTPIRHKVNQD